MSSKREIKKDHDPPPRVDEAIEKGEDPGEEPSEAQREGMWNDYLLGCSVISVSYIICMLTLLCLYLVSILV
jgi:hypothetical protein